jgi:hypothetical protein
MFSNDFLGKAGPVSKKQLQICAGKTSWMFNTCYATSVQVFVPSNILDSLRQSPAFR